MYYLEDISSHPDVTLTRGGMILIGLLSGGDYHQAGLAGCGTKTARGLAKCGLGDSLYEAAINLPQDLLPGFLSNWRNELRHELRTDSRGNIGKKHPSLAKSVPDDFPNIDVLLSYTQPVTSETVGSARNRLQITWDKEPDLGKIAALCEFYFEWGYKERIIKRFRTVIWPSAVLRIMRRAALNADQGQRNGPSTPKKKGAPVIVGTPSKMIAKHFSSQQMHSHANDDSSDDGGPFIIKIHSTRTHASTDGILEYRLEVAPAQLVRLTEAGVKGIRRPEDIDKFDDDEDDDDEEGGKGKSPPDPSSHLRVWIPASIVRLAEPDVVEKFEEREEQKRVKKAGKGKGKARAVNITPKKTRKAKVVPSEQEEYSDLYESDELPVIRPPIRKGKHTTDQGGIREDLGEAFYELEPPRPDEGGVTVREDLKAIFAVKKSRDHIPSKSTTVSAPVAVSKPVPVKLRPKPKLIPKFVDLSDEDSDAPKSSTILSALAAADKVFAPGPSRQTATVTNGPRDGSSGKVPTPKPFPMSFDDPFSRSDDHFTTKSTLLPVAKVKTKTKTKTKAVVAPLNKDTSSFFSSKTPSVRTKAPLKPKSKPDFVDVSEESDSCRFGLKPSSDDSDALPSPGRIVASFAIPHSIPHRGNDLSISVVQTKNGRKNSAKSSESESHEARIRKSPRKSREQISPRSQRIASPGFLVPARPPSPSPIRAPPRRTTKVLDVINISSDSDTPRAPQRSLKETFKVKKAVTKFVKIVDIDLT